MNGTPHNYRIINEADNFMKADASPKTSEHECGIVPLTGHFQKLSVRNYGKEFASPSIQDAITSRIKAY